MSTEIATTLQARISRLEAERTILRRLTLFPDDASGRERTYRFIEASAAEFPIWVLCAATQVSRSAYYGWRARTGGPSEACWAEAVLADQVFDVWQDSKGRYGSPRVTQALWRAGVGVGEKQVARLMRELGIAGKSGRRKLRTTRRDPAATPAPDLLERDFTATAPDERWAGDITYIPTGEGFLFLASVFDIFSRRLLGFSMAEHMRTELCTTALTAALGARGITATAGTVFHSDHGCQYTSEEFRRFCAAAGITQSMGTVGDSYDNAMAESVWASLKRELVDDANFRTKAEARHAVFEWIAWYNTTRLHSSLGYVPPCEYEESWSAKRTA